MSRKRHRSRLFRSDPGMLLLGEEATPASTASVDAPEPRGVRVQPHIPAAPHRAVVVDAPVRVSRAASIMERVTGDVLSASATVFDEGYAGEDDEPAPADTPLRIYVGSPSGQAEDLSGLGRVWDASALAAGAAEVDEPVAAEGWEADDATESIDPVPSGPRGGRWIETDDDDPFAPPKEGRWAESAVASTSMRRQPEEEWTGGVYDEVEDPTGSGPAWARSAGDDFLRPLSDAMETGPPVAADSGDWQLGDEEDTGGMPSWALEPELPPPPPIRMGGPSRLERELSRHWDAEEQPSFDPGDSGSGLGSGVREPWDVTVSGAWRRPAHLATGEHRRPANVVPEFRHLDDEPDASRWTKISAAALSVVLVCVVALQFGSDKPVMLAPGDLLDVAWSTASGPAEPAAAEPSADASPGPDPAEPASAGAADEGSEPSGAGTSGGSPPASAPSEGGPASQDESASDASQPPAERRSLPGWADTGRLTVTTDFPATVYVDGERVGRTPLDPLELTVGMHDVKVVPRSGGRARSTRARVDSGRAAEVSFTR